MSTSDLSSLIDAEIANLQQARALIASALVTGKKRPGRQEFIPVPTDKPRKRKMSPATCAEISAKAKARWAAIQKSANSLTGIPH